MASMIYEKSSNPHASAKLEKTSYNLRDSYPLVELLPFGLSQV